MKKMLIILIITLTLTSCGVNNNQNETISNIEENTIIESSELSESIQSGNEEVEEYVFIEIGDTINVDGKKIDDDSTKKVYLQNIIESHSDVDEKYEDIENKIITITDSGNYKITGSLENGQIMVNTTSKEDVKIVLDNVSITNYTAPAILILNANEKDIEGEGSVTLFLNENSVNNINGANTAEHIIDNETIKNDGAISTNVSLVIDGAGELNITAEKEGIETKKHLTINNGNLNIEAKDDSINASEDNISHITSNGGYIYAKSILGEEGDGIDSNGYITINNGNHYHCWSCNFYG